MQSSFASRVSQLISVIRASADIESDTTCNAIKYLVPPMFWLPRNNVQYPPVAELKQQSKWTSWRGEVFALRAVNERSWSLEWQSTDGKQMFDSG
jgi:hypothetical protein